MYEVKKDWLIILLFSSLFLIFGGIVIFLILINSFDGEKRLELIIQIIGMFFTSLALLLTFKGLRNEHKQKNTAVRPYLVLEDIDFAVEKDNNKSKLDFDFYITNKGIGIANRVTITIKTKADNIVIFNKDYVRIEVDNNENAVLLAQIRDEINIINQRNGHSISYSPYFGKTMTDEFYIKDYDNIDKYKNLIMEVIYFDIYGKKFKGTFDIILDDDYDLQEIEEKLEEWN